MLNEIVICPAEVKHIDEVYAIEQKSFPDPWSKESFISELFIPYSKFYVAIKDSTLVGYTIIRYMHGTGHILNLATHPDFRHKGIGKKMLQYLIDTSKETKIESLFLEVRDSNIIAQKLYLSFGFKIYAVKKKYYINGENALLMSKIL